MTDISRRLGYRYEPRQAERGIAWGIWDHDADAWQEEPRYGAPRAVKDCRILNEAWDAEPARSRAAEQADSDDPDCRPPPRQLTGSTLADGDRQEAEPAAETGGAAEAADAEAGDALEQVRKALALAVLADFLDGGREAIARLRRDRPHEYFKVLMWVLRLEMPGAGGEAVYTVLRSYIVDSED